ncbi:DUF5590 domain-containing protein [Halobacillus salinarum]|uniref:DUF5590 domain-containing protein n=1 Tax=Halobacillus salinarum TaxID=2932257 RepID=A0ABY4EF40_9BACI|nr:DUF5590 domain-containing protein [Halobacillus salinarum]UOQ42739.1 DUF5590 domain-containing protein [Halobacillus salinarum]
MKRTMIQQSSRFTVPNWLKWFIGTLVVLILLFGCFFIWMYVQIEQDRTSQFDQAKKIAVEKTDLTKVEEISRYNGASTVHIVRGQTNSSTKLTVFLDVKDKKIVKILPEDSIISLSQMKQKWASSCNACQLKDIQLGYEESKPVYEITYIDNKDRYVLDYYLPDGNKFQQRFAFKRTN